MLAEVLVPPVEVELKMEIQIIIVGQELTEATERLTQQTDQEVQEVMGQ